MLQMCKASRKKSEIKTMNSNPPLFLVVKFKNVNKKSKTITEKKHDGISLLQFDNTQNAKNIKRKGPLRNLCGDTTILKKQATKHCKKLREEGKKRIFV